MENISTGEGVGAQRVVVRSVNDSSQPARPILFFAIMHAPLVVQSVPHINTHKRILARSRPPIHYKTASCALVRSAAATHPPDAIHSNECIGQPQCVCYRQSAQLCPIWSIIFRIPTRQIFGFTAYVVRLQSFLLIFMTGPKQENGLVSILKE